MRYRIRFLFPLLVGVLLGACAVPKPEIIRTRNLLVSAGFYMQKPETPEQNAIYAQMPDCKLESGVIQGKRQYNFKMPGEGLVYVGGEPEYQQYERLLSRWKKAQENALGRRNRHGFPGDPFAQRSYWREGDSNQPGTPAPVSPPQAL